MIEWRPETFILLMMAPFIGSFLGVLVIRLPKNEDVVSHRSHCRSCSKSLSAIDLIPILSWVASSGKCRHCGAGLSIFYPAIEFSSIGIVIWATSTVEPELVPLTVALGWVLLTLGCMDLRDFFLSDWLTLPLVPAGLITWWLLEPTVLWDHVAAAGAGLLLILIIDWAYRKIRGRAGLGLGDAKLMAAAGAWTGLGGIGSVLLLGVAMSAIILLCWRALNIKIAGETAVPLGTGLAAGIWLTWLYGPISLG